MSRAFEETRGILLCIDDSHAILQYERELFERSGYIVVTAVSARRGLKLATIFSFDAVLLDYEMPEMNGHHVAYELKRLRPETSVVMFASTDVPDETRMLVDAVVPKDEVVGQLLPIVTQLVTGCRQLEQPNA